jgi:hypothetical protein
MPMEVFVTGLSLPEIVSIHLLTLFSYIDKQTYPLENAVKIKVDWKINTWLFYNKR